MNQRHFNLLCTGPDFWNNWRLKNPRIRPDLSETDIIELDLSKYDLSNTCFDRSKILMTNMSGCLLSSASFQNSLIEKSCFEKGQMTLTSFEGAKVIRCNFNGSKLLRTKFNSSVIRECTFDYSEISNASFGTAAIVETRFNNCTIVESSFKQSTFLGGVFTESFLLSNEFEKVTFQNTLANVTDLQSVDFSESIFNNFRALNCTLQECKFVNGQFIPVLEDWQIDSPGYFYEDYEFRHSYKNQHPALFDGSKLYNCNFYKANLGGVSFRNTKQSNTSFVDSKLKLSDMTSSILNTCDFQGANLNQTLFESSRFSLCEFGRSQITNIDFSECTGLITSRHYARSSVDNQTLSQSQNLDLEFLRGLGLTDWEIEVTKLYAPAIGLSDINDIIYKIFEYRSEQPLQFYSCFISYSNLDETFAKNIYEDLQDSGVRCWYAPEELKAGQKVNQQINEAIHVHEKLIIILSEESLKSDWVKHELRKAVKREDKEQKQILFPISLISFDSLKNWEFFDNSTGIDIAERVREYFIPVFDNWQNEESYQKVFNRFLGNLKSDNQI